MSSFRFKEPTPPTLRCPHCLQPVWNDPVQVIPCRHTLCRSCASPFAVCPLCLTKIESWDAVDPQLTATIASMVVRCDGCGWEGRRCSFPVHQCDSKGEIAGNEKPWVRYGFPQMQYDELCSLFVLHENDDGEVGFDGLRKIVKRLGIADVDAPAVLRSMGRSGSATMSLDEFCCWLRARQRALQPAPAEPPAPVHQQKMVKPVPNVISPTQVLKAHQQFMTQFKENLKIYERRIDRLDAFDAVFEELQPHALALMLDHSGSVIVQCLLDQATLTQRIQLAAAMANNVVSLSLHRYGNYIVQKALDVLPHVEQQKIISELDGHVLECALDLQGSHVISLAISLCPGGCDFIIRDLIEHSERLATTLPGSHVLCHAIQRIPKTDASGARLVKRILHLISRLSFDINGSYVTLAALARSTNDERTAMIETLITEFDSNGCVLLVCMVQDTYASHVVEKLMELSSAPHREVVALYMRQLSDNIQRSPNVEHFIRTLELAPSDRLEDREQQNPVKLLGRIVELSRSWRGSRRVQELCDEGEADLVFEEVMHPALELMSDAYGNYVIQRLFDENVPRIRWALSNAMKGHVAVLSIDEFGSFVVQKAIDVLPHRGRIAIAKELDGHVIDCAKDKYGNHVLQKCIAVLHDCSFIASAFLGHSVELSTHAYASFVMQAIFQQSPQGNASPVCKLGDEILLNIEKVASNECGGRVVTQMLLNGTVQWQERIIASLPYVKTKQALSKAAESLLDSSTDAQRISLLGAIITEFDSNGCVLLVRMVQDTYASHVVEKLMELSSAPQREVVADTVQPLINEIQRSSSGEQFIRKLKLLASMDEVQPPPSVSAPLTVDIPLPVCQAAPHEATAAEACRIPLEPATSAVVHPAAKPPNLPSYQEAAPSHSPFVSCHVCNTKVPQGEQNWLAHEWGKMHQANLKMVAPSRPLAKTGSASAAAEPTLVAHPAAKPPKLPSYQEAAGQPTWMDVAVAPPPPLRPSSVRNMKFLGLVVDGYAFSRTTNRNPQSVQRLEQYVIQEIEKRVRQTQNDSRIVVPEGAMVFFHPDPADALSKNYISQKTMVETVMFLRHIERHGWTVKRSGFVLKEGVWKASMEDTWLANEAAEMTSTDKYDPIGADPQRITLHHIAIVTSDKDHVATLRAQSSKGGALRWCVVPQGANCGRELLDWGQHTQRFILFPG